MHMSRQSKISGTVVIHTNLVYIIYMPDEEINEFLKVYLDNLKGYALDMESLTEEFNLFTVYKMGEQQ